MTVEGIDISRWQDPAHDGSIMDGCAFVGIRATYGLVKDVSYDAHEANARAHGCVVLAYCFGRYGDGVAQARKLVASAPHADLYVLDQEKDGNSPGMTNSQAQGFFAGLRGVTSRHGVLYHSESGFPNVGQELNWVANWDGEPGIPWNFWQYSGSPLDRDRFNGTLAQLHGLAGTQPPANAWTLHVAKGATVKLARLSPTGCIASWDAKKWTGDGSSAPCSAPQTKQGCESGSARVVRVAAGAFAGKWVRLGVGVSATEA